MLLDAILDWEWKQQLAHRYFTEPNVIHVTELVQCRKKSEFFDKFKEVFTINPPILVGRFVHMGLQEWLKKEYNASVEVEFKKELGNCVVVGQVDAIVRDWIVEIKYAQDVYDNKPYEHHILQVKLYLWLTDFEKGKLIYITPKKLLEFDITEKPTDDEVWMLYDTWKSPMWDWECSYCPFNQICPNAIQERRK